MASRLFTAEEANEALAEVRRLAAEMVERRRALVAARRRRADLAGRIAGNGGDIPPSELAEAAADIEQEALAIAQCVGAIQEVGAVVKDLDQGLIDFPAVRDGEEVLLCWQLGEPEVGHWHGLEDGFAGRQPL
jgi:hypothetical protein